MNILTQDTDLRQFKLLADASPMPMAVYVGKDMVIGVANTAMLKLWGKPDTVVGMKLSEAIPELEGQPFFSLLDRVFATGETYEAKEDRADLIIDGKLESFYFTFIYKALQNEYGQTIAIINTAADVTELVNTRRRIAQTEEMMSFALTAAGIGTWNLFPATNTVTLDATCRRLLGFKDTTDVKYDEALTWVHPDDKAMVDKAVLAALDPINGGGTYDVTHRIFSQDTGDIIWVHSKGQAYFDQNNQVFRFAGIIQDITASIQSRHRELQLLSLVNNNADHMSVASMSGEVLYLNKAARKLLGVEDDDDSTHFAAQDFYKPAELKRVQQDILPQISAENGWQGIIRLMNRKTKEEIPCQVNYILVKDPVTGQVIGRGATARDLRPEIKAQAELQRLATMVDVSEDFCNYSDTEGNTVYMNPSGCKLIGCTGNDVSQYTLFDYHSPESCKKMQDEIIPQLYATGKWSGQLELKHLQTGERIPIHKQAFLIREQITGAPVAIAGIARDLRPEIIARQSIAEKNAELNKALTEYTFLANSVPSFVWTCLPDGKIDYINKRWYDESGMSEEETLGYEWEKSLHPDDVPHTAAAWAHSLATGDPFETEYRFRMSDGIYRWYLVRARPLRDASGAIIKWYGTSTDVQVQKELEKQKDNFLGIASHELKTPVTSLKAYAQVMEVMFKRSGDKKNADLVAKMDKQLNRLNSLIGDLLDVTKINTGKLQFSISRFDFLEMVEEVIEDMQRTTSRHVIRKDLHFTGTLEGDRNRISQVVVNLLSNAIKYSPLANEIVVYTKAFTNEIHLCVQDFGIGISQDKKDKVFEQFYRVSGATEHTFPGLGLGLFISSEIVKRLGGRIWVNSVEGKGSLFCISLPLAQNKTT